MTAQPLENKNSVERTAGDGKLSPQEVHYMKEMLAKQTAFEAVKSWCNTVNIKLRADLSQWDQRNSPKIQPYLSVLGLDSQSSALDKASAFVAFQKKNGLTPSGSMDSKIENALQAKMKKVPHSAPPARLSTPTRNPLASTLESHESIGQKLNLASVTIAGDSIANGLRIASNNKKIDNAFSGKEVGFIASSLKYGTGDLLFQGGTNNIFHRKSAQDTFTEIMKFIAVAKGKGYANVILSTIPSGPKLNQNEVQQLNNMIRQSGHPYIDIAAQSLSYSDGIHLKDYRVANNLPIQKNGNLASPTTPVIAKDTFPKAKVPVEEKHGGNITLDTKLSTDKTIEVDSAFEHILTRSNEAWNNVKGEFLKFVAEYNIAKEHIAIFAKLLYGENGHWKKNRNYCYIGQVGRSAWKVGWREMTGDKASCPTRTNKKPSGNIAYNQFVASYGYAKYCGLFNDIGSQKSMGHALMKYNLGNDTKINNKLINNQAPALKKAIDKYGSRTIENVAQGEYDYYIGNDNIA